MLCKGCIKRHKNCHVDCEGYNTKKSEREAAKAKRKNELTVAGYKVDFFLRYKKKVNK